VTDPVPNPVVRIECRLSAPPRAVYRAWLDPGTVARWMAPGDLRVTRVEIDERVGGHYRVWQGTDQGDGGGFECVITDLVPDRYLAFRWAFVGPDRTDGPMFDSVLTVSLADAGDGRTDLVLVHERLDDLRVAMPDVADLVGAGWEMVLGTLEDFLAGS
jgi:uncharacterized protein YndB with AHSA1/START domain